MISFEFQLISLNFSGYTLKFQIEFILMYFKSQIKLNFFLEFLLEMIHTYVVISIRINRKQDTDEVKLKMEIELVCWDVKITSISPARMQSNVTKI